MDAEKKKFYMQMTLIVLGWAGICGLLYFFLLAPLLKEDPPPEEKPIAQPKKEEKDESAPEESSDQDPFTLSFTQTDIKEAKSVLEQFVKVIYEGERSSRDRFVNQLRPYTTDKYLNTFKQANGLGEPIKIKEKHISHIEHGTSIPAGWISFNSTVVTENGEIQSTMYFLTKESGTWRVTEEADSFVPED